jgi:excisionase family DNA binding protein
MARSLLHRAPLLKFWRHATKARTVRGHFMFFIFYLLFIFLRFDFSFLIFMNSYYSVKQLAFIFKVHPLTIRRYIAQGKLKAVRVGGNVRVPESELSVFNQAITPQPLARKPQEEKLQTKVFTEDDSLFQMEGRGASLK